MFTLISEDDDDDDDTEALLAELEQIKKEKAEEKLRKVSLTWCSIVSLSVYMWVLQKILFLELYFSVV